MNSIMHFWQSLLGWLPWLGLGTGSLVAAAWFFGLMPVLGAAAQLAARVLGPILEAVVEGIVWAVKTSLTALWEYIIKPGGKDILDSLATIILVGGLVIGTYLGGKLADDWKYARLETKYTSCQLDLKKAKKKASPVVEKPSPLPWLW